MAMLLVRLPSGRPGSWCASGELLKQRGSSHLRCRRLSTQAVLVEKQDRPSSAAERARLSRILHRRTTDGFSVRVGDLRVGVDVMPPPLDEDLQEVMLAEGAEIEDGVVVTFGNDAAALEALRSGVAVTDLSHFGRLRVSGDDRTRFLQNATTADVAALQPGAGCDTVFVTPTARTIDLVSVWVMRSALLVFTSPETRQELLRLMDRYIFPTDKVVVEDISDKTNQIALVGPGADALVASLGAGDIVGQPHGVHMHFVYEGTPLTVAVGTALALPGYTALLSMETAGAFWASMLERGAEPMGFRVWEAVRIQQGRPSAKKELTSDYNPLEAGLWRAVSLNKGCYMGQETIARLVTYNGVKQHLWGIRLEGPVTPGSTIMAGDQKAGVLTSFTDLLPDEGPFGLGYIRRQIGGEGLEVEVDGVRGVVVRVPFLTTLPIQPGVAEEGPGGGKATSGA